MDFEQKIEKFIKKQNMAPKGTGIVIGLSGGADSVALLEVLCSIRETFSWKLAAVHVHHGIRLEADRDVEFCRQLCAQKQIPFWVEYADVPMIAKTRGMTVEEAGRQVRYASFETYRNRLGFDVIAVAHHQNDQAETVLFQLFRGSGLKGLAGIPVVRGNIIRPLMAVSRQEIEAYLSEKKLSYVIDSTNAEDVYARNKIRHYILPVAEEICTGTVEHINRTGMQLREVWDYMTQETQAFLGVHGGWDGSIYTISLKQIRMVHIALQKMIVLEALECVLHSRKDITERHVQSVLSLLEKEGEKVVDLPKGCKVMKDYERLLFVLPADNRQQADPESALALTADRDLPTETESIKVSTVYSGLESESAVVPKEHSEDNTIDDSFTVEPDRIYRLPEGTILRTRLFDCDNFPNKLENIPKSDCIKWFDYDKIKGVLSFRNRRQGDYLTVREDGARKSLQDYFVNEKIPKRERDNIKVLADGQHIVWVPGKRISAFYKITKDTKQILEVQIGGKGNG